MWKLGKGLIVRIAKESVWRRNNSSITGPVLTWITHVGTSRQIILLLNLRGSAQHIFRESWKKDTLCENALLFYFDHLGFNGSTRTFLWCHPIWAVYFYLYYWSHYFWKFILLRWKKQMKWTESECFLMDIFCQK